MWNVTLIYFSPQSLNCFANLEKAIFEFYKAIAGCFPLKLTGVSVILEEAFPTRASLCKTVQQQPI